MTHVKPASVLPAALVASVLASAACAARAPAPAPAAASPAPAAAPPAPTVAAGVPVAFDEDRVRNQLFAAMEGDDDALARAEQACDDALRRSPADAEALVMHGIATSVRSWRAFQTGDVAKGRGYWGRAASEMDRAVALAPENVAVRIPRGATLFGVASGTEGTPLAHECLEKAVGDYEATLRIQGAAFDARPLHDRSELLWGLADGWQHLGDSARARTYYARLVQQCSPSPIAAAAQKRLDGDATAGRPSCKDGCHGD
jgi:hypothetical protein